MARMNYVVSFASIDGAGNEGPTIDEARFRSEGNARLYVERCAYPGYSPNLARIYRIRKGRKVIQERIAGAEKLSA